MNKPSKKNFTRRRKKVGDLYEIETAKGLAYFQYNLENHEWSSLIRVLQGFYKSRPSQGCLAELVKKSHRFQQFLALNKAIREKYEGLVFVNFVPTSENLAAWLFKIIQKKLESLPEVTLDAIELWETPKSHCRVEA